MNKHELEQRILKIVKGNRLADVSNVGVELRSRESVGESVFRQAIWRLIDRGQLNFTWDWKLELRK